MNAMPDPAAPAVIVRTLAGWGLKYFACSVLTILLPMYCGALVLVFIALTQPGAPLHFLDNVRPQALAHANDVTLGSDEISRYLGRGFLLVSLTLTLLAWLWRTLRRRGKAELPGAAPPVAQHLRLHVGRRLLVGIGWVSTLYIGAFIAIPFVHMAAHQSHAGLFGVFIVLYILALAFTAIYVVLNLFADWVLDG